jgi:diguanylate cyclase (GGDEF)-like protein
MHKLLSRQLKGLNLKAIGDSVCSVEAWENFLNSVSDSYEQADKNREMIERSLKLASDELTQRNRELRKKVNELKSNQEIINFQASHDGLTQLPNRSLFIERLHNALSNSDKQEQVAVLFVDLDGFKKVNDTLGHQCGDELLCVITKRLSGCLRKGDTLARLGGDEFVIIIENSKNVELIQEIGQRFLFEVNKPCQIGQNQVHVSASIGVSLYPKDGRSPDALIRKADIAMYHAKESGRNNLKFFNLALERLAIQHFDIEQQIRNALETHQIELFYQPKVELSENKIVGLESNIHWGIGGDNIISTSEIDRVAEKAGLIKPIQQWMFEETSRQLKAWYQKGLKELTVCTNVTKQGFFENDFVEKLKEHFVKRYQLADRIVIEVPESILMEDFKLTKVILEEIKQLGMGITLDNFGAGYSSLSCLLDLPVDYLKMDKIFVKDICNDEKSRKIVFSIIDLAHKLNIKVIANDVEDKRVVNILTEKGCDILQGNYFYPSLPVYEVEKLFEKNRLQG